MKKESRVSAIDPSKIVNFMLYGILEYPIYDFGMSGISKQRMISVSAV